MKELVKSIVKHLKQKYNMNVMIDWYIPGKGLPVTFMVYTFSRDGYYNISRLNVAEDIHDPRKLILHCINQAILEDIACRLRKSLTKSTYYV